MLRRYLAPGHPPPAATPGKREGRLQVAQARLFTLSLEGPPPDVAHAIATEARISDLGPSNFLASIADQSTRQLAARSIIKVSPYPGGPAGDAPE